MKPTTKTLIVTLLLFFITTGVMAQEKYEYAIVQGRYNGVVVITHEWVNIPTPKTGNAEIELVKKLEEMSKEGWEVIDADPGEGTISHTYYLRRKVKI